MCYYENYKFACSDWKWGNFRQHCQAEYRMGETCGMKMVYQTVQLTEKCAMCAAIERKTRRYEKHRADYVRWSQEGPKYRCSMEKAAEEMKALKTEIEKLTADKQRKYLNVCNTRR